MKLEGTYKFEQFKVEIKNPNLIINEGIVIHQSRMMIDVSLTLAVEGMKFGIILEDVLVDNLNYSDESLIEKVLIRLNDFKVN
jgi:hypothetical protein